MNRLSLIALAHRRVVAGEHLGASRTITPVVKSLPRIIKATAIKIGPRSKVFTPGSSR